jgi:hypothetical protein
MLIIKMTDESIIKAFKAAQADIVHTDAPTEMELCVVRSKLKSIMEEDREAISLHWLRNKIVKLRKAGKLK